MSVNHFSFLPSTSAFNPFGSMLLSRLSNLGTSTSPTVPPWNTLPPEILCTIFELFVREWFHENRSIQPYRSYSSFRLQRVAVGADWRPYLLQVCQRWRAIALSCTRLWRFVILDRNQALFEECMKKSQGSLLAAQTYERTDLDPVSEQVERNVLSLETAFQTIEFIDFTISTVEGSQVELPALRHIRVVVFATLGRANKDWVEQQSSKFLARMPALRSLQLVADCLWPFPDSGLPTGLRKLQLSRGWYALNRSQRIVAADLSRLSHLRHLHLGRSYLGAEGDTSPLSFPFLKHLALDDLTTEQFVRFFERASFPFYADVIISDANIRNVSPILLPRLQTIIKRLANPLPDTPTPSKSSFRWALCDSSILNSNISISNRIERTSLYPRTRPRYIPSSQKLLNRGDFSMDVTFGSVTDVLPVLYAIVPSDLNSASATIDIDNPASTIPRDDLMETATHALRFIGAALNRTSSTQQQTPTALSTEPTTQLLIKKSCRSFPDEDDPEPPLPDSHMWTLEHGSFRCSTTFDRTTQESTLLEFGMAMVVDTQRLEMVTLNISAKDWRDLVGSLPNLKVLKIKSRMDLHSFVDALDLHAQEVDSDGEEDVWSMLFPALKEISFRNVELRSSKGVDLADMGLQLTRLKRLTRVVEKLVHDVE
ncbi:hypothetical protein DL96DRAFT_1606452 [Flagelloscypha sp. PMI_526]|nr:hypothetical protein DL96DRAFT_1606452 [Flagelloscypha sp. PMI_526]